MEGGVHRPQSTSRQFQIYTVKPPPPPPAFPVLRWRRLTLQGNQLAACEEGIKTTERHFLLWLTKRGGRTATSGRQRNRVRFRVASGCNYDVTPPERNQRIKTAAVCGARCLVSLPVLYVADQFPRAGSVRRPIPLPAVRGSMAGFVNPDGMYAEAVSQR